LVRIQMARLPIRYWVFVAPATVAGALLVGIPTAVIPNPFFTRMTPGRPLDFLFLGVTALLLGLLVATYVAGGDAGGPSCENKVASGGILSILAVGCPICNKLAVLALGVSGALTYFAPIQPFIGLISAALLIYALRQRLQTMSGVCPIG
jgi:hypothetical protein